MQFNILVNTSTNYPVIALRELPMIDLPQGYEFRTLISKFEPEVDLNTEIIYVAHNQYTMFIVDSTFNNCSFIIDAVVLGRTVSLKFSGNTLPPSSPILGA